MQTCIIHKEQKLVYLPGSEGPICEKCNPEITQNNSYKEFKMRNAAWRELLEMKKLNKEAIARIPTFDKSYEKVRRVLEKRVEVVRKNGAFIIEMKKLFLEVLRQDLNKLQDLCQELDSNELLKLIETAYVDAKADFNEGRYKEVTERGFDRVKMQLTLKHAIEQNDLVKNLIDENNKTFEELGFISSNLTSVYEELFYKHVFNFPLPINESMSVGIVQSKRSAKPKEDDSKHPGHTLLSLLIRPNMSNDQPFLIFDGIKNQVTKQQDKETANYMRNVLLSEKMNLEAKTKELLSYLDKKVKTYKLDIDLSAGSIEVTDAVLKRIVKIPKLKLRMMYCEPLQGLTCKKCVNILSFKDAFIYNIDFVLSGIKMYSDLKKISFNRCNFTQQQGKRKAIQSIFNYGSKLQTIKIKNCGLDDSDALVIKECLEANDHLTELDLSYNKLTIKGLSKILHAHKVNTTLANLTVKGNLFTIKELNEQTIEIIDKRQNLLNTFTG